MRKTKFTAIIFLIVASMLSSILPVWAQTIDKVDLINFDFEVTLTSSNEYGPVVYGVDYGTSSDFGLGQLPTKKFGRQKIDGVWNGFATLNFDNITGGDFAAYVMELKDGATEDITDSVDAGVVAFDLSAQEDVALDNLYFALATRGEDGIEFAGIPVTSAEQTVGIALSEFADGNNFLCSTGTGTAIDLSKFCGLGFVRMNVTGEETAPASSGRIYAKKLAVLELKAIDDVAVEAIKGDVYVSFTAPTVEGLEYTIDIEGNDGSQRSVTLAASDFDVDGINFVWKDTEVEPEVTYSYTITLADPVYGLSSVSNTAAVRVPEDLGGTDIPTTGSSSTIIKTPVRNYAWFDGVEWLDYALGAPKTTQVYNPRASRPDMASQTIMSVDLAYDNTYVDDAQATEFYGHKFDYYVVGYIAGNLKGGPSSSSAECTNISAVADTGSVVYRMYIDETMELSNAYFTIGQRWFGGNKDRINFAGVPMYDYVSDDDKGQIIVVSIPLSDFKMSNPNRINRIWSYSWDSKAAQEEAEADLNYFNFIGVMRDCNPANEQPQSSGNIYISDMMVSKVDPVTNFEVRDVSPSKITLGWEHSETIVKRYNIYRDVDGAKELVGTSVINRFADTNNDNGFVVGDSYTYYIEAVDEMGIKSHLRQVTATVEPVAKPRNFKVENYYSDTDALAVDITWQAAAYGDVAQYVLYRNGVEYQVFDPSETAFRDEAVAYGRDYTYYMYAVNSDGDKSINTEVITVTAACVPNVENVQYAVNDNDVTFSWNANANAQEYSVRVNGQVYTTTGTSLQVNDLPYNTEINAYVWATNAAGAKSLEYEVRKFTLEKPNTEVAQTLFNETIASGFKLSTSGKVATKTTTEKYIVDNIALLCDFSERLLEDQTVGLSHNGWNIKSHRDNNASLTFWMYADESLELDKLSVAMEGTAMLYWGNRPLRSSVALGDLITEKNKWVYVEIPLTEFADTGIAEYQGQFYEKPLDYAKIRALTFVYNNSESIGGAKFYLDDIRIVKGTSWSVTGLTDENANAVNTEISANAKALEVSFSQAMDGKSFTTSNVWVEDAAGDILNTVVSYENGKGVVKFMEPLAQGTAYTLNMNVKSAKGVSGSYTKTFTSNQDAVSGDMMTPSVVAPVITSTSQGSAVTIKLAMPEVAYNVENYNITLTFDKQKLTPNGNNAVTAYLPGAQATVGNGVITISGNANKAVLSGDIAQITFAVAAAGQTTVTAGGNVDVINMMSNDITSVAVNAAKTLTVSKGGAPAGGGGGGGGGSSSGTAGRDNATIKGDEPIDVTGGEASDETTTGTFTDINSVPWAKDAISALIKEGIISGYPDNTVKPEKTITREEFASLLVRTFSFKSETTESPFADVANDAWYASAIIVAQEKGIVSGVDSENFGIGSTITREDMCTMIYRAIQAARMTVSDKYDEYVFADNDSISQYARDAVNALYKGGIISGVSDTEFAPKAEVNRAMAARVLYGVLGMM